MMTTGESLADADFNSIKVRLEPTIHQRGEGMETFQFHKGAIRTLCTFPYFCLIRVFQFHKGAIRTEFLNLQQLKLTYFNSIKVRLEQNCTRIQILIIIIFQFHKGAIRTSRQLH